MPFVKTHEVIWEFFNVFLKNTTEKNIPKDSRLHPMLTIPIFGSPIDFMVRYYKRSGDGGMEDVYNYYPCIVMQDFSPEIDSTKLWGKDFIEGYYDKVAKKREVVTLPIPMKFKFQVSSFTLSHKELLAVNDWFNVNFNFNRPDYFLFNSFMTYDGLAGDVVPYKVSVSDGDVDENRFSTNYSFELSTYLHAKFKDYSIEGGSVVGGSFEDTLENIIINLSVQDLKGVEKELIKSFSFS